MGRKYIERLTLEDVLVIINGVRTIPEPERVQEVQELFNKGLIARHEVNQYLSAGFN